MTNPTPPSASADNEGSCPHDNYPLKYVDSPDKCSYCGKPRYRYELREDIRNEAENFSMAIEDMSISEAEAAINRIMLAVTRHTRGMVDRAVLAKAIELRNIAEAHLHESSAAWAIAQEIGAEVSRLKAELAAPAVPKTGMGGGAADE